MHDTLFCLLFCSSLSSRRTAPYPTGSTLLLFQPRRNVVSSSLPIIIPVDAWARDMSVLRWRGCFGMFLLGICVRSCVSCCKVSGCGSDDVAGLINTGKSS
jgi:hypothetical protein